jgi:hypothetical protein
MRLLLIGCEVILRELCDALARSPHQVDVEFLPKGLHDLGAKAMRLEIQARIDRADSGPCDAIVLGYGLCGNGVAGLRARSKPLVLPRAHDCITLLMGSRQAFEEYFAEHTGTYYRSIGWVERGQGLAPMARDRTGVTFTLDSLIERYGEDNGRFLHEELTRYQRAYSRLTYIATELDRDGRFEAASRREAAEKGWAFEKLAGNLTLFRRLMAGDWDSDDFLLVPAGQWLVPSHDERIVRAEAQGSSEPAAHGS